MILSSTTEVLLPFTLRKSQRYKRDGYNWGQIALESKSDLAKIC